MFYKYEHNLDFPYLPLNKAVRNVQVLFKIAEFESDDTLK